MKRNSRDVEISTRKVSRRALFLAGSQLAFMGILGLRMRYMQVDQADEFRLLAEEGIRYVQLGTHFELYQLPNEFFEQLRREDEARAQAERDRQRRIEEEQQRSLEEERQRRLQLEAPGQPGTVAGPIISPPQPARSLEPRPQQ